MNDSASFAPVPGGVIGQPLSRVDGHAKVTGRAQYAAEYQLPGLTYGVLVTSTIAKGRIQGFDASVAQREPGVLAILTHENIPRLAKTPNAKADQKTLEGIMMGFMPLTGPEVFYSGQPVAIVVADTFERATHAAALLKINYQAEAPIASYRSPQAQLFDPKDTGDSSDLSRKTRGNPQAALAAAPVKVTATYTHSINHHNPMEPGATTAHWEAADRLTVYDSTQGVTLVQQTLAALLGLRQEQVRVVCKFIGGGFGSKYNVWPHTVLATLAAKAVQRPVKLVLRREQMFGPVGHRAPTRQTLRMGTDNAGLLMALGHHAKTATSTFDEFIEPAANASHTLYASPAISTSHEAVRLDTGTPLFMRAPGEAPGSAALESAIDEMALACGMDPLAFRLVNYAEVEPITGKPFSSKALRQCYEQGAARFGWAARPQAPRQMRDAAGMLVGWGMGTAVFPALMFQGQARAVLLQDGRGIVETGAHDMGQGAWTGLAQIAADALGLDLDRIEFRSGSSDLPDAGIAGGSAHTATVGMAIDGAGADVIGKLADLATNDERSPLFGAGNAGLIARGGRLHRRDDEARSESYADILARAGLAEIEGRGTGAMDPAAQSTYAMHAHGAVFAEVTVDPDFGQVRVTRLVGAFAAGTVVNPRMVRSQYYGGMIWGVSFALHEHAVIDKRTGRPMNPNLGEYHVPVNADVPSIEAILVEERDVHVNALGIKGVGEIGITGTAGAIANAVWHATGVRVRSFPITLDQLIEA